MRRLMTALIFLLVMPMAFAQTQQERESMQAAIDEAQRALSASENVGAPVYARDLYEEALTRLNIATNLVRSQMDSSSHLDAGA